MEIMTRLLSIGTVATCFLFIGMTGCSRHEAPPLELLGAAKMALHNAEQDDHTAEVAPADLQSAQRKINAADQAIAQGNNVKARRLSEQAIVEAQLAKAKTQTTLSRVGANEERSALQDLQHEIRINQ